MIKFLRKENEIRIREENYMKNEENYSNEFKKIEKNNQIKEEILMANEEKKIREIIRLQIDAENLEKQKKIEEENLAKQKKIEEESAKREMQKAAEKKRLEKEKNLRKQRLLEKKRNEEELNLEKMKKHQEELENERLAKLQEEEEKLSAPEPLSLEVYEIDETLKLETELIQSMDLICGSSFCIQCYRMLKRTSLFLKCSGCCDKPFIKPNPRHISYDRKSLQLNSICIGCNNNILRGETVKCICCYLRSEFLKDYSTNCEACCDPDSTN